ncbi:hypothetical protein L873DRAFT_1790167 [Choiromyces venosus 120613-1]|uniref:CCHC-type domain-containing protein n=1 Tax=Choiromyces venosus 120613-1 TaxID=1336337 RepID=A0A3N4JJZ2_9PEZI|nr:hypothetical protein L873DRAFT_1790167 [Choiromyces venosus 120613-1]
MERNYTAAVRAINADSRKRHRMQPGVVITRPPPKPDKDSEDFISLNFDSGDESKNDDDVEDSNEYSPSEDLKTTQTSLSAEEDQEEEDKENEFEDGISEKTRSQKRRRKRARSSRKDSAAGKIVVEEAMKAVAKSDGLIAAEEGVGKSALAAETIEIKSSSSSSSSGGGAYLHDDEDEEEDKDSLIRKAQQQQQELKSTTASSSSSSSSSSPNTTSKSQSVGKKAMAEGGKDKNQDPSAKTLRKLAKHQKRKERRRVERAQRKAALGQKQKKVLIDHPRGASFGSVPSDIEEEEESEVETNESRDEGLEINLEREDGGEEEYEVKEEEEDYIPLSMTNALVYTTSTPHKQSISSSPLVSPSPTPPPTNRQEQEQEQEHEHEHEHEEEEEEEEEEDEEGQEHDDPAPPAPLDRKTIMFQLRYHTTIAPPPFIHEESRPLFASTKDITPSSFRVDTSRFLPDPDSTQLTMANIICDVCLAVGHARRTCRLLKVLLLPSVTTNSDRDKAQAMMDLAGIRMANEEFNARRVQCEHCGAWDEHFSNACPEVPAEEVALKDYNWRKIPPTHPPNTAPLRPISTNCYNCAGTEHFGDDCPFLPPLSHPGSFSLTGVNDNGYASQEWLCEKQDRLAELEDSSPDGKKIPAYGRAVYVGEFAGGGFDPFADVRVMRGQRGSGSGRGRERERERENGRRRAGGGGMQERSPRGHVGSRFSEFERYRERDRERGWERERERDRRRSRSPPPRRAGGGYYPGSGYRPGNGGTGGDYSRVPPPPPSIPPPPPPPPPPPQLQITRHGIPSRPPVPQNQSQARRGGGSSARGGSNAAGGARGGRNTTAPRKRSGGRGLK